MEKFSINHYETVRRVPNCLSQALELQVLDMSYNKNLDYATSGVLSALTHMRIVTMFESGFLALGMGDDDLARLLGVVDLCEVFMVDEDDFYYDPYDYDPHP